MLNLLHVFFPRLCKSIFKTKRIKKPTTSMEYLDKPPRPGITEVWIPSDMPRVLISVRFPSKWVHKTCCMMFANKALLARSSAEALKYRNRRNYQQLSTLLIHSRMDIKPRNWYLILTSDLVLLPFGMCSLQNGRFELSEWKNTANCEWSQWALLDGAGVQGEDWTLSPASTVPVFPHVFLPLELKGN